MFFTELWINCFKQDIKIVFYYKLDGIQKYIDIKENQELRKDVEDMLGVGDIVFNRKKAIIFILCIIAFVVIDVFLLLLELLL